MLRWTPLLLLGCSHLALQPGDVSADASPQDAAAKDAAMPAPGCGLAQAAFCDTFDAPSATQGRAGELDAHLWSAGRIHGGTLGANGVAVGIGMAKLPGCRDGIPDGVWPDRDSLICDATADLQSNHLLIATAAQNYGQNGYRVRQPFDFAGRTGKIVFDATEDPSGPLYGWLSLAITEDPIAVPSFALLANEEGTTVPRNAVEVHFFVYQDQLSLRMVHVFHDYADTVYYDAEYRPDAALAGASQLRGKLNHYEVLISEKTIEVHVSPYSEDGVHFDAPELVYTVDAQIPFTRGYVQLSLHNHATLLYSGQEGMNFPVDMPVDAPVARVDNFGFDGPVIGNWREYDLPDSLVKAQSSPSDLFADPYNVDSTFFDIGYFAPGAGDSEPGPVLYFQNVDLTGATAARVSLTSWYLRWPTTDPVDQYDLRYRINKHAWHDRLLSPEEAALFVAGPTVVDVAGVPLGMPQIQGMLAQMLDVPLGELVAGDNTIEFQTQNVPTVYKPVVANISLVLTTN